jgi:hypothetical protein
MAAGSTYTPIATQTLSSTQATVTFSSIPQTYTDLVFVCNAPSTSGSITIDTLTVNGDTGSNYSYTRLTGISSVSTDKVANDTSFGGGLSYPGFFIEIWNFMNYSNTTTYKGIFNKSAVTQVLYRTTVNLWRSTNAITSFAITNGNGAFAIGSTFTLYGIKAA